MPLLNMIPACARKGCGLPGIVRVEWKDDKGATWAYVCPLCMFEGFGDLLKATKIAREDRRRLEGPPPGGGDDA
jgi:hypothetical protein